MDLYKSIFYLTIYLIIFGSILFYNILVVNKQNIINNWAVYRCNPLIMPFAGLFGYDSSKNMSECINVSFKSYFNLFIQPFQYMIDIIKKILSDIIHQIDSIRTILRPIREFFARASSMVFEKVQTIMGTVIYSFLKINNLMKRIFANFRLAVYTLEATQMTTRSVWDGPIGQNVRFWAPTIDFFSNFFCFSPDTIINGKKIENIMLDDNIYGKLEVFSPNIMYNYNDVIVSGNHLVLHQNKWIRIKEVGTPILSNFNKIYSIYTRDHRVLINNTLFCDYEETDLLVKIQKKLMLKALHSNSTNIISECPNLLGANISIKCIDGTYRKISNLSLGDKLYDNDTVLGIITQRIQLLTIHNYGCNNIIYHNGKWILLSDIYEKDTIVEKKGLFYNIITTKGYYYTSDYIIRDYLEVHDINIFNKIADTALSILNLDVDTFAYQCATLN